MKKLLALAALPLMFASPVQAQDQVDPEALRATVKELVGFGTRHSLSQSTDPSRGIKPAREWVAYNFEWLSDQCGGCLQVMNLARTFEGPRAPDGVNVVNVLAFQKGRDPNRVVIVMGHLDSRASDVMDATSDAPGANDNASGVALVMEAARLLSKEQFDATIIYAALSGEEQGLWGAQLLAETAKERGWVVSAVLNNDMVGNTIGQNGKRIADRVRVFSEGIRASEDLEAQLRRRGNGGEDDGPSRALAKAIAEVSRDTKGIDVFVNRRPDRFGRGGDHEPFLRLGYPAVRFTVAAENYDQQHQDVRTENGRKYGDTIDKMDFDYMARIVQLNLNAIRRFANAPAVPENVRVEGAVSTDTTVRWNAVSNAAGYRVHWRRNDAQDWTDHRDVPAGTTELVIDDLVIDDHFVGVSSRSAAGDQSIVAFAGRGR